MINQSGAPSSAPVMVPAMATKTRIAPSVMRGKRALLGVATVVACLSLTSTVKQCSTPLAAETPQVVDACGAGRVATHPGTGPTARAAVRSSS